MKNFETGEHGGNRENNSVLSVCSCSNQFPFSASICVNLRVISFSSSFPSSPSVQNNRRNPAHDSETAAKVICPQ
jgi:hypothetical protein